MHTRHFTFLLLAALLLGVLVACGTGSGPAPAPKVFQVSSVSTDIAAHGETVNINGTDLDNVTVLLGSLEVVPSSQSGTKITFIVPDISPSGPQTLTIREGDKTSDYPLFVGVDFPSGTLEDLAALNLPPGTAVRLAETTYASSGFVRLDNLSLYGAGPTKTLLDLELLSVDPDAALALKVDPGSELVMTNLSLHLGSLKVTGLGLEILSALSADMSVMGALESLEIETMAAPGPGSFTFDNVVISDGGSGEGSLITFIGPDFIPVQVHILNSEFIGAELAAMMMAPGLTIMNSVIEAKFMLAAGIYSPVVIQNSRLETSFDDISVIELSGGRGLYIDESEFISTGKIEITDPFAIVHPMISTASVSNSSFTVLAPAGGLDPDPVFEANFMLQDAVFDNVTFAIAGPVAFGAGSLSRNRNEFTLHHR